MHILILSYYYQPDLSAGSFRATALVQALLEKMPAHAHIEVITTAPNRYHSYSAIAPRMEQFDRLTIHRIPVPAHQSGMLDQSRAYLTYALAALGLVHGKNYDLIFVTSGRLMTAVLGSLLARWKRSCLYLDIRDIFVDTINDVLSKGAAIFVGPFFSVLERFALTRAQKVNLVSEGFWEYFHRRYPKLSYSFYTNGVDPEFVKAFGAGVEDSAKGYVSKPTMVVYAGNMGEGQGLHAIIPKLAERMGSRVHFKLIGDGGRRVALERAIAARGVRNVEVVGPMGRSHLIEEYRQADVLFLHLNDYGAFRKVLPSKIFEYGATGKPIWAGVGGFPAQFLKREIGNAVIFSPCDVEGAEESFSRLDLKTVSRQEFVRRFSREVISLDMAGDVLSTLEKGADKITFGEGAV